MLTISKFAEDLLKITSDSFKLGWIVFLRPYDYWSSSISMQRSDIETIRCNTRIKENHRAFMGLAEQDKFAVHENSICWHH